MLPPIDVLAYGCVAGALAQWSPDPSDAAWESRIDWVPPEGGHGRPL
jgi:hypothetical protein